MCLTVLDDLIPEVTVYERYDHLLKKDQLLKARNDGKLGYYKNGASIYYTMAQLVAYFETMKVAPGCERNPLLNPEKPHIAERREKEIASASAETNGSSRKKGAALISVAGMTPKAVESAASLLAQEF